MNANIQTVKKGLYRFLMKEIDKIPTLESKPLCSTNSGDIDSGSNVSSIMNTPSQGTLGSPKTNSTQSTDTIKNNNPEYEKKKAADKK